MNIEKIIIELISELMEEYTEVTEILMDDDLTTKGMDSMMFVELITLIEEKLEIELSDESLYMEKMNTPKKIIEVVGKCYGENKVIINQ